jgi:hypothetical protein
MKNVEQLHFAILQLLKSFDAITQIKKLEALQQYFSASSSLPT